MSLKRRHRARRGRSTTLPLRTDQHYTWRQPRIDAKKVVIFDRSKPFKRLFVPFEDGYLVYPSKSHGGKFVTTEEYEALIKDYQRWWGKRFGFGLVYLVLFGGMTLGAVLIAIFDLPEDYVQFITYFMAMPLFAFIIWSSRAPYRLVRGRPDAVPPLSREERKRWTRSNLSWFHLIGIALVCTVLLWVSIENYSWTLGWSLWMACLSIYFLLVLRIALLKYLDIVNR